MARKHDRRGTRTVYTYVYLRKAAHHSLKEGKADVQGSTYAFMFSVLGIAFFLEAYLNHIGPHVDSKWKERAEPHEKLKMVAKAVGLELDHSSSTYQGFNQIFGFRDALVHGRTHELDGSWPEANERPGVDMLQWPPRRLLFPSLAADGEAMLTDVRKMLDRTAPRAGWRKGEIRTKMFRHTYCAARLQTLDSGHPVSSYTVSRELGHGSREMVERVYGHLGTIRCRWEVVEYRAEAHGDLLRDPLAVLGDGMPGGDAYG